MSNAVVAEVSFTYEFVVPEDGTRYYAFVTSAPCSVSTQSVTHTINGSGEFSLKCVVFDMKVTVFCCRPNANFAKRAEHEGTWHYKCTPAAAGSAEVSLGTSGVLKATGVHIDNTTDVWTRQYAEETDKGDKSWCEQIKYLLTSTDTELYTKDSIAFGHRNCLDPDLPGKARFSLVGGMYHVSDSLYMDAATILDVFTNCVRVAVCATMHEYKAAPTPAHTANITECIFCCALRVYAGHYPDRPELRDDRCLRYLKLYSNGDCDDMALTSCSFFNALMHHSTAICDALAKLPEKNIKVWGGIDLSDVFATTDMYTRCEVAMGEVTLSVATAGRKETKNEFAGHVWCVLTTEESDRHLHLECTRFTSPHAPSDTDCTSFELLYGKGVFLPRTSEDTTGSRGLLPFRPETYNVLSALYTSEDMHVPLERTSAKLRTLDCAYAAVFKHEGYGRHLVEKSTNTLVDTHFKQLRHKPSYTAIRELAIQMQIGHPEVSDNSPVLRHLGPHEAFYERGTGGGLEVCPGNQWNISAAAEQNS